MNILLSVEASARGSEKLPLQDVTSNLWSPDKPSVLGVFDGHGEHGEIIAQRAAHSLEHETLKAKQGISVSELALNAARSLSELDKALKEEDIGRGNGTTAAVVIFKHDFLDAVSIGDSEAVFLADDGETISVIRPHNVTNEAELQRMVERRHPISLVPQQAIHLAGSLALSRTIGSHGTPFLSGEVETRKITLYRPGWLVLGTDGLWGHNSENRSQIETMIRPNEGNIQGVANELVGTFSQKSGDDASIIIARIE
ncbi:MAG: hypothetical protein JWL89_250 [Candidatus Saccharibacteria bacterium]|nr:hypothetical protein [Candidatus Saccharibacteria bacterium]